MENFENTIDIQAPIERVYTYLADFPRHGEWSTSVKLIEKLSEGDLRAGSELRSTESIPGKFYSYTTVTALEPPRRIAWRATDQRFIKTAWEFELTPTANGTRLAQRVRFEGLNWRGNLVIRLFRGPITVKRENQASLERVRVILEQDGAKNSRASFIQ